ncbi:MAG: hypothetical protein ACRDA5_09690 [Clostridium sp.]
MNKILDRIKFDKWFHIVPLISMVVFFLITNRVLKGITIIVGALIAIGGLRYRELMKK